MIPLRLATDGHMPPIVRLAVAVIITVVCLAFVVAFWWLILGE